MKTAAHYRTSAAPHLRTSDATFKIFWTQAAALLPALVVSIVLFPLQSLFALGSVWITAAVSEFLCAQIFKRKFQVFNVSTFLTVVLFLLLLPSSYPIIYMMLGICIAIFGRELFGGKGICFIHAALLGNAFLQLSFPVFFRLGSGILFIDSGGIGAWLVVIALSAGGAVLFWRRVIDWEIPVLYISTILILEKLSPGAAALSIRHVLFTAFFLLLEPGTLPLTRKARRLVAFLAALTAWLLDSAASSAHVPVPEVFAVLLMNFITVWLDQWLLPSGTAQTREMVKV